MKVLSLRMLRSVAAVGRLGKISLAAQEIGLTAPAVTLQIQQAEAEAGTALFDRTSGGMRATDAGRAFVSAAQAIDERLRLLADDLAMIRDGGLGTLRLGGVSTAKYFVPQLMAAFMAEHPGVEVQLTIGNRAETIAALDARQIDVALMGRPPRDVPVSTYLIGDHPQLIIARPDHPLAGKRRIAKRRIATERFLLRERGSGTRTQLELYLGDISGRLDDAGAEFTSNETIKQAVMAGLGVAFISAHTVAMEVMHGHLAVLDVVGTPVWRHWFAVSRADRASSPAMNAFQEFIGRRGRDFLPNFGAAAQRATSRV